MQSEERKVTVQITFLLQTSKGVKSPWASVMEVSVVYSWLGWYEVGIVGAQEFPFKDRHISIRFNCIFKVQKQIYYKQSIYISSEVFQ